MPVSCIITVTSYTPSSVAPIKPAERQAANAPKVAITSSFAIKPVIAATANTQPFAFS